MLKRHLFNFEKPSERVQISDYDSTTLNARQNLKRGLVWGFAAAATLTATLALRVPAQASETPTSTGTPTSLVDDQPSGTSGP